MESALKDLIHPDDTEKKLAECEARIKAIAGALPGILFIVDEEGYYLDILTSEENLLYVAADKLKGKKFHDIFDKDEADIFLNAALRTINTGISEMLEYQLDVPAGRKWFEGRTGTIDMNVNGKRCAVFFVRDITDKKRAEELESKNLFLEEELKTERHPDTIIGTSPIMKKIFSAVRMVAGTDTTVLLLGETGVGKELIAQYIHTISSRKRNVIVTVNCAALPPGLVESELFGHEKGAFTGAAALKKGKFEVADKGTIFLDEIGELPPDIQVKLLRVLEEHSFERVGSNRTIKTDVRVIAATNKDLSREVGLGTFRADLFYRLNIFPLIIPTLRERKEDIPALAAYFIKKFGSKIGKQIKGVSEGASEKLMEYNWPGNVRELANILERAVILCGGNIIEEEHLGKLNNMAISTGEIPTLEESEKQLIIKALTRCGGVLGGKNGAAELLGVNRSTLWSRMHKLGITVTKNISDKNYSRSL